MQRILYCPAADGTGASAITLNLSPAAETSPLTPSPPHRLTPPVPLTHSPTHPLTHFPLPPPPPPKKKREQVVSALNPKPYQTPNSVHPKSYPCPRWSGFGFRCRVWGFGFTLQSVSQNNSVSTLPRLLGRSCVVIRGLYFGNYILITLLRVLRAL